jgi:hypothetical protein
MPNAHPPAGTIRVVLAGVPGLTASLIHRFLVDQSDIVILHEFRRADDLNDLPDGLGVDVVVTECTADGVPQACRRLLFGPSGVPVIAIGRDGRLEIYDRRFIWESAMDDLLAEIRKIAAPSIETGRR